MAVMSTFHHWENYVALEKLFIDQGQLNDSSSLSTNLENQLVALLAISTKVFVWAAALAATLAAVVALTTVLADRGSTALLLVFICKISLYVVLNAWFVLRGDTSLAFRPLSLMLADRGSTALLFGVHM